MQDIVIDFFSKMVNDVQQNLIGYIIALLIGILGSFIVTFAYDKMTHYKQSKKIGDSKYSGAWIQEIYDVDDKNCEGKPLKIDEYDMMHIRMIADDRLNINVTGTIQRLEPTAGRKWDFKGYLYDGVLTILYQSVDSADVSRGCIFLRKTREADGLEENQMFKGYYLADHRNTGNIEMIPLILRRKKDEK